MRRYFEIYAIMFRNSLIREMSFKANFLLWIVVELLWFLGQIVFIEVIFQYVDAIGDWTKWEMILLIGTHQFISQVFQAFFYLNLAYRVHAHNFSRLRPRHSGTTIDWGFSGFVCVNPIGTERINNPDVAN